MSGIQRDYPRIDVELTVILEVSGAGSIECDAHNISCGGLHVSSEQFGPVWMHLLNGAAAAHDATVSFRLDAGTVVARCAVVYAKKRMDGRYEAGLEYIGFEQDGYEYLERYSDEMQVA